MGKYIPRYPPRDCTALPAHGEILPPFTEDGAQTQGIRCPRQQLTNKPPPLLHPELLLSVPWPTAISSGHEMWHLVTHASPELSPATPVPPGPAVTCSRCGFGVHLRSLRAGVSALPGRAAALPCPRAALSQPSSSAPAPQQPPATNLSSIIRLPRSKAAPLLERREKQENCLPSDLPAGPHHQAMSPPAPASSLMSTGQAPALPALGGLAAASLSFSAALQRQRKRAGAGSR